MVTIRGARAANRSELNIPARRKFLFRPDAICFCFVGRLSPQAKDLCGKLSTKDNITLSPAYGGRKKRNGETGQCKGWFRKNKSAGLQEENSLFSPLASSQARGRRQSSFSAKRRTRPFAFHRGRQSRRASRDWIKWLLAPAHRRRPDAISFCFVGRLSPQA